MRIWKLSNELGGLKFFNYSLPVRVSFKSGLRNCVKIIAGIAAAIGIYIVCTQLVSSFNVPMSEGIISGKSIAPGIMYNTYIINYHTAQKPDENLSYEFRYPESFYRKAQVRDILQIAKTEYDRAYGIEPYRRLIRDGHVVARAFSTRQYQWSAFTIALLLPSVIFIPCQNKFLKNVFWVVAVSAEAVIIIILIGASLCIGFINFIMSGYHEGGRS